MECLFVNCSYEVVQSPRCAGQASRKDIRVSGSLWVGKRNLLGGAELSEASFLGANSMCDYKLDPYCIYVGLPASLLRN